jgi:hypothetical protein
MQSVQDPEQHWNELRQAVDILRKAVADPPPQLSNEKYSEMYTMALAVLRCLDALDPKVPVTKRPSALQTLSGTPSSSIPNVLQPIDESGRRLSASFFDFGANFLGQRPLTVGDFFATRASFSMPPADGQHVNPLDINDPNAGRQPIMAPMVAGDPSHGVAAVNVVDADGKVVSEQGLPAMPMQPPAPQTYVYRHPAVYPYPITARPALGGPPAAPGDSAKSHPHKHEVHSVAHAHHDKTAKGKKRASSEISRKNLVCVRCKVTDTPEWRRGPEGILCNACGLRYMKSKKAKARTDQQSSS